MTHNNDDNDHNIELNTTDLTDSSLSNFVFPIQYSNGVHILNPADAIDLELVSPFKPDITTRARPDPNGEPTPTPIYSRIYNTDKVDLELTQYYTTDVAFIQATQQIITHLQPRWDGQCNHTEDICARQPNLQPTSQDPIQEHPPECAHDFCSAYQFVRPSAYMPFLSSAMCTRINTHAGVQRIIGMEKICHVAITMCVYMTAIWSAIKATFLKARVDSISGISGILYSFLRETALISVARYKTALPEKWCWLIGIATLAFYAYSAYQSSLIAIDWNTTCLSIRTRLTTIRANLALAVSDWDAFSLAVIQTKQNHPAYATFGTRTALHVLRATELIQQLDAIDPPRLRLTSPWHLIKNIGAAKSLFYKLHQHSSYVECRQYLARFREYIAGLHAVQCHVRAGRMNPVQWLGAVQPSDESLGATDSLGVTADEPLPSTELEITPTPVMSADIPSIDIRGIYYPSFLCADDADIPSHEIVTNDIRMRRNWVITGPNASGKTTLMKSVFINILLAQQFGFGCCQSMTLRAPFAHFHSYLNIPDTSGRDSLFQAEARRGKEIIDCVELHAQDTHLCIFDELFSGTNPADAVVGGVAMMKFFAARHPRVTCLLTTHFTEICSQMSDNKPNTNDNTNTDHGVDCMQMKVIANGEVHTHTSSADVYDTIVPCYQVEPGISHIHCGIQILREMNYPDEVVA